MTNCDLCNGLGWIITPDGGVGTAHRCSCRYPGNTDRERRLALSRLGFPDGLLEPFEEPEQWPRVRNGDGSQFLESWSGKPWAVFLYGDVGVGKSYLGVELCWRWIRSRRLHRNQWTGSHFVTCRGIVDSAYHDREALRKYQHADLLFIDDLGESIRGGSWDPIAALISERCNSLAPTIVTSNLPLNAKDDKPSIFSHYPEGGARIVSRLQSGLVARVTGPHRRGLKHAA